MARHQIRLPVQTTIVVACIDGAMVGERQVISHLVHGIERLASTAKLTLSLRWCWRGGVGMK